MKFAIISDVHSNFEAFEKIIEKIEKEKVDKIYSLGDLIGYGASPNECFELFKRKEIVSILGNHEKALIEENTENMNKIAGEAIDYTKEVMKKEYIEEIRNWGIIQKIAGGIVLCHGTPLKDNLFGYIFTKKEAKDLIDIAVNDFMGAEVYIYGHTHLKSCYRYNMKNKLVEEQEITYKWKSFVKGNIYLINPGAVGQPRDGDTFATALIIDTDKRKYKWIKATYNIDRSVKKIISAGLPKFLAERLFNGS